MKNNLLKTIIKYILLFTIFFILFNIISGIIFYMTFKLIFPLDLYNYDLSIENLKYIKIISILNYIVSIIVSGIITFKKGNNIIDFFKIKCKKILIHTSILISIPLIVSIVFSFIEKSFSFNYIEFLFTFFYGGISGNQLVNLIYYIGIDDYTKIVTFFFIKLLLVIIYTNFLGINNNKILYTISILLGIIGTITGYIFLGILMSV